MYLVAVHDWKKEAAEVAEVIAELLGLLIIAVWMGVLSFRVWRARGSTARS